MLTLTKIFEFSASHTLFNQNWSLEKNLEVFGKCANPNGHGHNFTLEVTVTGPLHSETNMIIDAGKLKTLVNETVLKDVDHRDLNRDVPWLKGVIPTVEGVVTAMWNILEPILAEGSQIRLVRLKLWETATVFAVKDSGNG